MKRPYPAHIYDPIRRQIAIDYLRRELRKLFPSILPANWQRLNKGIALWFNQSPELTPVRDFWNGFWGIAMGFKLKIGLLDFITGENISWKKEQLGIDQLYFGGGWPPQNPVGKQKYTSVLEVKKCYRDQKVKEKQLKLSEDWAKRRWKDDFPLIITEKEMNSKIILPVYDGNMRLDRAILLGKEKITAWIGRFKDERYFPANYWVPTPLLMELVWKAKKFWKEKDNQALEKIVFSLRSILEDSQSGIYELKNRVLSPDEKFQKDFWEVFEKRK